VPGESNGKFIQINSFTTQVTTPAVLGTIFPLNDGVVPSWRRLHGHKRPPPCSLTVIIGRLTSCKEGGLV